MGAQQLPTVGGAEGAPIDLNAAAEQMIQWLDTAAEIGWESYFPLWKRLLASVGGTAGVCWEGVWPILHIGYLDLGAPVAGLQLNFKAGDGLIKHLRGHGFRSNLLAELIGDGDGTVPGAMPWDVRRAVSKVVLDFLNAEGRILVDPEGRLTEGAGMPHGWLEGGDAERVAIEDASRAYYTATACRRAVPMIKDWVDVLGHDTPNGWRELTAADVRWAVVHARYQTALSLEQAYNRDFWQPAWEAAEGEYAAMPPEIDAEIERLQDVRCAMEDFLFDIPSPDAAAFATKVIIARDDGRDLNGLDDILVAEAKRFALPSTEKEDAAFARWKAAKISIEASADEDDDEAAWEIVDKAELLIFNSRSSGSRIAEMRLWIGLAHTVSSREDHRAIAAGDLANLVERAEPHDWEVRCTINALCALRGHPIAPARIPLDWRELPEFAEASHA